MTRIFLCWILSGLTACAVEGAAGGKGMDEPAPSTADEARAPDGLIGDGVEDVVVPDELHPFDFAIVWFKARFNDASVAAETGAQGAEEDQDSPVGTIELTTRAGFDANATELDESKVAETLNSKTMAGSEPDFVLGGTTTFRYDNKILKVYIVIVNRDNGDSWSDGSALCEHDGLEGFSVDLSVKGASTLVMCMAWFGNVPRSTRQYVAEESMVVELLRDGTVVPLLTDVVVNGR